MPGSWRGRIHSVLPNFSLEDTGETPPVPCSKDLPPNSSGESGEKPRNSLREIKADGNIPSNDQDSRRQMMDEIPAPFKLIPN